MADNIIGIEGFEKYTMVPNFRALLELTLSSQNLVQGGGAFGLANQGFQQEWNTLLSAATAELLPGLAGTGYALAVFCQNSTSAAVRALPSNYARLILGSAFAIKPFTNSILGFEFLDSATAQASIGLDLAGRIYVYRGALASANILWASDVSVSDLSRHYLEIDITINNSSGAFQVWLDGVSLVSLSTQNTRSSANNYLNAFSVKATQGASTGESAYFAVDDMYWRDNTGGTASPYGDCFVRLMSLTSDSSVAFAKPATVIGWYSYATSASSAPGANQLALVPVTPPANATINSIGLIPKATSAGAKLKGVIYSDNSGAPGSLLSSGTEVVGTSSGTALTLALVTPQALTGGTQYWIGFITDTSVLLQANDNVDSSLGQTKANTYTSDAPAGPLSSMSTGSKTWSIWGNCTSIASNYANVTQQPPALSTSGAVQLGYNGSSTATEEDLFGHASMPVTPSSVKIVKVSALAAKSDAGARTMSIRVKSNTNGSNTDGFGDTSSFSPTTTPLWYFSLFTTDPDTGVAWTGAGVNNCKVGYKVET